MARRRTRVCNRRREDIGSSSPAKSLYDPSRRGGKGHTKTARELERGESTRHDEVGTKTTPVYLTLRDRVSSLEAQYGGVGRMGLIVLDFYHRQNGSGLMPFSSFKQYARSNRGHFEPREMELREPLVRNTRSSSSRTS